MNKPERAALRVARIYLRVSTEEQDLARQEAMVDHAKAAGYYIAGVYREKASGARADSRSCCAWLPIFNPERS